MAKQTNKPKYRFNIFFNIEERGPNGRYKVLVDNCGYVCGIYGTYKHAKAAIPKIRRNLVRYFKKKERLGLPIPPEVQVTGN